MRWRCGAGLNHPDWGAPFDHIRKRGSWCPKCGDLRKGKNQTEKKITLLDAKTLAVSRGGVCVSATYQDSRSAMIWGCGAGLNHPDWPASLNNVQNAGTWCPECARCASSLSLEDAHEVAKKNGGTCLSATYINNKLPLLWGCGAGLEHPNWFANLNHVRNDGEWCPECGISNNRRELECRRAVESLLGPSSITRRPSFLYTQKSPLGLELDIYYPQFRFAIEVQGIQHRKWVPFFHKTRKRPVSETACSRPTEERPL